MADKRYTIMDANGKKAHIFLQRDKRLKKSCRWIWQEDGSILMRVPYRISKRDIGNLLDQIAEQLTKQDKLAQRRTDSELHLRAKHINKKYFRGKIEPRAIRWVSNMNTRLGSCTNGGATDGHIRISDKIKDWPQWVIDYVIAHEMVHRLHSNHSKDFWEALTKGYPLTERARGFIKGVGFTEGNAYEDG